MPSVSEPTTLDEAAAVLGAGERVSIEREGGDVVLSTAGMNRVLEHEPGDLTAIVEAGLRLSELQAYLATHGQMLALDPPGDPTIGACLAADLSGPRRHRYGAMRDLVIGVTVVLAGGLVASSGGKVVKNVAGYDLGKLFSGSHGRLGLIARVALRLHPRPAAEATVVARDRRPSRAVAERSPLAARAERGRHPAAGPGRVSVRRAAGRRRGSGGRLSRRAQRRRDLGGERQAPGRRRPRSSRLAGLPARAPRPRRSPSSNPRPSAPGRRSPNASAPRSTPRACSPDGRRPDRRLRPLRVLPADAARPTSSGTRRWIRRAAGSG